MCCLCLILLAWHSRVLFIISFTCGTFTRFPSCSGKQICGSQSSKCLPFRTYFSANSFSFTFRGIDVFSLVLCLPESQCLFNATIRSSMLILQPIRNLDLFLKYSFVEILYLSASWGQGSLYYSTFNPKGSRQD